MTRYQPLVRVNYVLSLLTTYFCRLFCPRRLGVDEDGGYRAPRPAITMRPLADISCAGRPAHTNSRNIAVRNPASFRQSGDDVDGVTVRDGHIQPVDGVVRRSSGDVVQRGSPAAIAPDLHTHQRVARHSGSTRHRR